MPSCVENQTTRRQRLSALLSRNKKLPLIFALALGVIGSIPLVLLTPPFQVPDEVQHFYRAYQLSELHISAQVQNGAAGGILPDSLPQFVKSSVYTRDSIFYPASPAPIARTLKLTSNPLDKSKTGFVAFPGSAYYSPLPYLPQVAGIAIGRALGLGPLYLLYLGRLFNCLTALALLVLAIIAIPAAEELVLLVGLLPMSLYLYASLSADAAIIACALLFTALSFSASTRGNWRRWELVTAAIAAAVFCSVKPVYAPLLLASAVPGLLRPGKAVAVIRDHAILVAVAMGAAAGWLLYARSSMTTPLGGAHPSLQMNLVFHHPTVFAYALFHSLGITDLIQRYFEAVGVFGWFTVALHPGVAYLLPLAGLLIVWRRGFRGAVERSATRGLWCLALALAGVVLVYAALYLICAHVGQDAVQGVQGRYFIPLFVLAGWAAIELLPPRPPSASPWKAMAGLACLIILQIAAMDATIIRAFQGF